MRSSSTISKLASINFFLVVFWMLSPYPRWLLPSDITWIFLLIMTVFLFIALLYEDKRGLIINSKRLAVIIVSIAFLFHFTTPFVHALRLGHMVQFLIFILLIPLNSSIIYKGYKYLKGIMVFISIAAVVYWVLNLLHISMPHYKFYPDFRSNSFDWYDIYGPVVILNTPGDTDSFQRICGVFGEPGHYGIYIGIMLAIEKFKLESRSNIILFIAGILTFSTAFYGIMVLCFIYRLIKERSIKRDIRVILFLAFTLSAILLFYDKNKFLEGVTGRVVVENETVGLVDMVENRALEDTKETFDFFLSSSDVLLGRGYEDINIQLTNWRGLIFQFGFVGLLISMALIYAIIRKMNPLYRLLMFSIALLIISHRAWIMYTPVIYMLLYIGLVFDNVETKKLNFNKLLSDNINLNTLLSDKN